MTPLFASALAHALSAFATAFAMTGGQVADGELLLPLFAALGGYLGGLVPARLYGQPGGGGWALAFCGALVATGIGAAVAGGILVQLMMGNALAGLIWAPVIVAMNLVMEPLVTLVWLAPLIALHLAMRRRAIP